MRTIATVTLTLLTVGCSKNADEEPARDATVEITSDGDVSVTSRDSAEVEVSGDAAGHRDVRVEGGSGTARVRTGDATVTGDANGAEVEVGNTRVKADDEGRSVKTGNVKVDEGGVTAGGVKVTPDGIRIGR